MIFYIRCIIIFLCIYCVNYDSRGKTPVETCVGIDLNRNFDFYWNNSGGASAAGCSGYYRGDKPFSEPESQNIEAFVRKRLFYLEYSNYTFLYIKIILTLYAYTYLYSLVIFQKKGDQVFQYNAFVQTSCSATLGDQKT